MNDRLKKYLEGKKLDPDFKVKWLAALRSGKYKQGQRELYNKILNQFCCLGVGGDVCGIPLEDMDGKNSFNKDVFYPEIIRDVPELLTGFATIADRGNPLIYQLTVMNDSTTERKTFAEIADWIEANL